MATSYWDGILQKRLSRRRALAATSAGAAGAALLVACGGDDDGGGVSGDKSGLVFKLEDEVKSAKRGGTYIDSHPLVLNTYDVMAPGGHIRVARRGYSQLLRMTDGHLTGASDGSVQGDAAQSWELSPDKLTLTLKLDPGAGFPPIPPVNGRVLDSDDVMFSWNRLKAQGLLRSEYVNSINAAAPILDMTAPDKQTLVFKLANPNATILPSLGSDVLGTLYIFPKEAQDPNQMDIPRKAIGTGPYYLTEGSDTIYAWKRNPNFKRAALKDNEPYIDEIREPVITDIATGTAQFRTGAIYEYGLPATEILQTKNDLPQLLLRAVPPGNLGTARLFFGSNPDSGFKDDRMRIAFMKSIDRDAYLSVQYNSDKYEAAGLPVVRRWETAVNAASPAGWWLDPEAGAKDYGEDAKNFQFDLTAAKQLIEAAGNKTPFEFNNTYAQPAPTSFPPFYYTAAEIWLGMIESSQIWKQTRKLIEYQTQWIPQYRFSTGKFTGVTWGPDTSPVDPTSALFFNYNSKGGYFMGGDATLDDLTNRARAEFDDKKRQDIVREAQKYNAKHFFNEKIGVAGTFALSWPVLRNVLVNTGGTNWMDITTPSGLKAWLDPEQPPLKKT